MLAAHLCDLLAGRCRGAGQRRHSSAETTKRHYLKAISVEQKARVGRLDRELFGSKKPIEMRRRKQPAKEDQSLLESDTPEWIRTADLLLRRQPDSPNSLITEQIFSCKTST
jgi:hypothetical protein